MLKILQARLQKYMNKELPDVQTGFRKGRGTRDQIANIQLIGKDPNTGKNEVRKRGTTRTRWLDGITDSMDMSSLAWRSLAWRILSITLLVCEMSAIVW